MAIKNADLLAKEFGPGKLAADEVVGHAVRAAYMYSGMADVAALTGNEAYLHAIDKIWDNVTRKVHAGITQISY